MKKKLLIFHPCLAPYRIDQFNFLSEQFDLYVVFLFDNVWNHKFDQKLLLPQLKCKYSFLLHGPKYKGRVFRFGVLKIIRQFNPDIIISYEFSFTTLYLVLLKRLGVIKQKLGTTVDDSFEICNHVQSKARIVARAYSVKILNYVVVLSKEVSSYYQRKFNLIEKKIIVFPLLQGSARLRAKSEAIELIANQYQEKYQLRGKKVLLFVGRLIREKAVAEFIQRASPIFKNSPDVIFICVGDGEEREHIEMTIKDLDLTSHILLPGRYEAEELYAWYVCSSGFILPSIYEPFGAVVNEALIFGVKVLCSCFAGARTLVDKNGFLFDPRNRIDTQLSLLKLLSEIKPKFDCRLAPPLLPDSHAIFIKEWNKVLYD